SDCYCAWQFVYEPRLRRWGAPGNPAPGNPAPGGPARGGPAPGGPAPGGPAPGIPIPGYLNPQQPARALSNRLLEPAACPCRQPSNTTAFGLRLLIMSALLRLTCPNRV